MIVAIPFAVAAGACFAAAGVLQQLASRSGHGDLAGRELAWALVRDRTWLGGIGLAVVSYGFQSVALAFGPLSLVQPLMVAELIFALPIAARMHHVRIRGRTVLGALAVAGGLALGVLAGAPTQSDPVASLSSWLFVIGGAAGLSVLAATLGKHLPGIASASLFAFAGAAVMGMQSALLDTTIMNLQQGPTALFGAWQTYVLVVASIVGMLLIQAAFHRGPLAASMPVIDAVEPAVAITIGILLFGETLADGWLRRGLTAAAALVVLVGIIVLDTAPATQALHQREEAEA